MLCSVPFDVPHIDMCTGESSEIRTPPYTGQLTVVPVVSLLQRFHYTTHICTYVHTHIQYTQMHVNGSQLAALNVYRM